MKKEKLKVNTVFFSKRFKSLGQCLAVADFMAYMIFPRGKGFNGWFHCQELEDTPWFEESQK